MPRHIKLDIREAYEQLIAMKHKTALDFSFHIHFLKPLALYDVMEEEEGGVPYMVISGTRLWLGGKKQPHPPAAQSLCLGSLKERRARGWTEGQNKIKKDCSDFYLYVNDKVL